MPNGIAGHKIRNSRLESKRELLCKREEERRKGLVVNIIFNQERVADLWARDSGYHKE